MATLQDIKRRIVGVSNTQQITKAMKMVAAAKLRRAQDNIINARPYSRKLTELLGHLINLEKSIDNPLVAERKVEKIAVVIVTSDSGLCGAFNMNIIRSAEEMIKGELADYFENGNLSMYCIGKKGYEYFYRRDYPIVEKHIGIFKDISFDFILKFMTDITAKFTNGDYDKVVVVYNEFKSVMQQNLITQQLLPIKVDVDESQATHKEIEYIYEPDKAQIINALLPKFVNAQMWKALLESYAAELGARMTAMDLATENAKEMIRDLKIVYNKERQASITTEILEIVSGAEALKNG